MLTDSIYSLICRISDLLGINLHMSQEALALFISIQ